jgi:glucose-6-phosphate 1-epimerase
VTWGQAAWRADAASPAVDARTSSSASGRPLPPGVRLTTGQGDLPRLEVATALASAQVYLHGAHVTAYAPRGSAPLLFLSRASRFAAGVPIRGGIPLVFPWFGRKVDDPRAPLHGLARCLPWRLDDVAMDATGVVELVFDLADVPAVGWPAGCALRYRVGIGTALQLALEVTNTGPLPITFEDVLHTYLAVVDAERIRVTGLEGASFLDETDGFARKREGVGPLVLRGETDRIYDDTRAACVVWDPVARRCVEIVKTGSDATVVWNPGAIRAQALADLDADEWREFVCVESGNVGHRAVTVNTGGRHRLTVGIHSTPWHAA